MSACHACRHPDRAAIDQALIRGTDYRTLAAQYGLSIGGLSRHKEHLKEMVAEAMRARAGERAEHGSELLKRIEEVINGAKGIAARAARTDQLAVANGALNTVIRSLELIGRLTGELATPGLGGIHFHATKNVTTIVNVHDDTEIAQLVAEATNNFAPEEISRLKKLAESTITCTDVSPTR
jgi:hypothetical protein